MYSIDSLASFNKIQAFVENIEIVYDKKANILNVIVIGNKSDLEDEREVSKEAGEQYAKTINAIFKEASAKTKTNVEESIFELVRKMRSNPIGTNSKIIKKKEGLCTLL
jgi:GTPase KRas